MKVFKTDVNKISLHSIILQLKLTLGHSMFKEIISVYSDSLVLISNYSFLFENSSSEIQALKGNPVFVVVALISEATARDGMNWYGYAGQNPMVYMDRIGLFYYTAEGQQSSTSNTPKTDKNDHSNKTPQNQSSNKTGTDASKRVEVVPEIKTNTTNGNSQEFQNIDLNAKIVKNNVQRLLNGKNAYESSNQDFYMLKIYINLPGKKATNDTIACSKLEQNNEEILTADGGHVFISLINVDFSTMHVQSNTFGLYPAEKTGIIIGKTIKGQIRDDSKSYYDNSFSFIISKTDYENALNFVNKASPKYNLYTNNCVDFAIKVADKANVKLPEFGIGSNPINFK